MVKFGFKKGYQRYQCNVCKRTRSDIPVNPMNNLRVPMDKAVQVIHLLCEGMGVRAIERFTRLNRRTVLNILEMAGEKAARFQEAKVYGVTAKLVEADEIHSTVFAKQRNTEDLERGDQYTFLAIDGQSKLIINSFVGKRTRENADQFLSDLKRRMDNRTFQLTTDNWPIYSGSDGAIKSTFGKDVNYATETKVFADPEMFVPRRVLAIKRKSRIGTPEMSSATTCHVERTNLSVRTFTRRFTRCTIGYSKLLANHKHAVALFVWHFNFCRIHSAHGYTPAKEAGLVSQAFTIEDLLKSTL